MPPLQLQGRTRSKPNLTLVTINENPNQQEHEIKRLYLENKKIRMNLRDLSEALTKEVDKQRLKPIQSPSTDK